MPDNQNILEEDRRFHLESIWQTKNTNSAEGRVLFPRIPHRRRNKDTESILLIIHSHIVLAIYRCRTAFVFGKEPTSTAKLYSIFLLDLKNHIQAEFLEDKRNARLEWFTLLWQTTTLGAVSVDDSERLTIDFIRNTVPRDYLNPNLLS